MIPGKKQTKGFPGPGVRTNRMISPKNGMCRSIHAVLLPAAVRDPGMSGQAGIKKKVTGHVFRQAPSGSGVEGILVCGRCTAGAGRGCYSDIDRSTRNPAR